jgi:hypothetical protein
LQIQQFASGHERIDGRVLEGDTDGTTNLVGLFHHVETRHQCRARGGLQEGREHAHDRALAGAVRAEQSEDLARAHFEVDAVDGFDDVVTRAEVADQFAGDDGGGSHEFVLYKLLRRDGTRLSSHGERDVTTWRR